MDLKNTIQSLADTFFSDILKTRRHLHQNPELSFQEHKTMQFVAQELKAIGLEVKEKVAGTGLVAFVEGKNPHKKTIALRADMDALPIFEKNEVAYKSNNEGVMHACGHDAHTASLLGAARILHEVRESFEGSIQLVFQPGEEKFPGGASLMIKEGVLEASGQHLAPQNIIGQHVMPFIPAGKVGFRAGQYMASADEIYFTVIGKGGHGAMPEFAVDPVLICSHIIVALQQIISRNCSPKMPSVLSFGKVQANGATNIIPDRVEVEGTFRTYDEEWRMQAHEKIKVMAQGIAEAMGARCEIDIKVGYPHLYNHPELTQRLRGKAEDYLGAENVLDLDLWLAGEDFAYYSQNIEACFYRLGTRNEAKGIVSPVHTPTFDIDEDSLRIGSGLMAWLAIQELAFKVPN